MLSRSKIVIAGVVAIVGVMTFDMVKRSRQGSISLSDTTSSSLTLGNAENASSAWKKFVPQSGKFSVLVPSLPQIAQEAVPLPNGEGVISYDMYLSQEKGGRTFMISLIEYPTSFDTSNPDVLLDGVMKEMLGGNANNELKSVKKGTYKSFPSIDFVILNKEFALRSKAFIQEKTLFVITVIDHNLAQIDQSFDKFIDSFDLKMPH